MCVFLSTPSARRATDSLFFYAFCNVISIHALREEGDGKHPGLYTLYKIISIHALREEGDGGGAGRQPTKDISIHALREEGGCCWSAAMKS